MINYSASNVSSVVRLRSEKWSKDLINKITATYAIDGANEEQELGALA